MSGVRPVRRYDGTVTVQDQQGRPMAVWRFTRAVPVKLVGPQLNARTGEIAIEELHLGPRGAVPGRHAAVSSPAPRTAGSKGAVLETLDRKGKVTATIPVQFNPASLRLTMSNMVDGGTSSGRQAQQYNGTSSTQLHVELEFDTADEGTTSEPVDVRTHTSQIAQFVLPGGTTRSRHRRGCSSAGAPSPCPA